MSFYCDDIEGTVADLKSRGVQFKGPVQDHGYGFVTYFTMPGGVEVQLYEPKYQKSSRPASGRARSKPARRQAAGRKTAKGARRAKKKGR